MTSPTDDVDPLDAATVAQFAECLRKVRTRVGNPSYRTLQQWGERNNIPLPRSTVQDALAGRRLARDVEAAGLLRIGASYLSELDWKQLFTEVTELDIVVAYGQTWRNLHARELAQVAARSYSRIRVFLADPHDEFTVALLADRFDITHDELRTRITATRSDYEALRRPDGAQIDVYYRPGDRVFSFYRFDDIAVVGFYSHSRVRGAAVPVFVCARPGELYEFIHDELAVILGQLVAQIPRHEIVLASTVGYFAGTAEHGFEPRHMRRQLEQSLDNLQTDHLDIYALHHPNFGTGDRWLHPAIDAMRTFRNKGLIRAI